MKKEFLIITLSLTIIAISLNGCIKENSLDNGIPIEEKILFVGGNQYGNYSIIQNAIDNTSSGDIVYVYSGIYYENIVVNKTINIIGEDRNTTIIDGSRLWSTIVIRADGVSVKGFTITNSSFDYTWLENKINISLFPDSPLLNIAAGIEIDQSKNVTIYNNIIKENDKNGIWLRSSKNIKINDNSIFNNKQYGILTEYGNNNTITNNVIQNNNYGILLKSSDLCNIFDNYIYNNTIFGIKMEGDRYSFRLGCNNNRISKNYIINNGDIGIIVHTSYNNVLSENTIRKHIFGIFLNYNSNNNSLYFNNLINNIKNAEDESENTWYNYMLRVGNYWSDYTEKYPNAIQTNGIWITPYNISGENNQDRYPLVNPVKNN